MHIARADYEKALQIEPSHAGAKAGMARLEQERAARNPKGLPECKNGETVSFKAKIVEVFPPSRTTQQTQLDLDNVERGCLVESVFFKSTKAPKGCVVGAMIEATGVVETEEGFEVWDPTNVSCK